ncbi:MAG TPA: class I lanthipeptide [Thermoanaerobaculia bacterium]|jgi:hypothetical protein|nr:class I lanthipeptide [Thermoanaerobaculia bacterium]
MKKQIKRLSLSRETINLLDGDTLTQVNGGVLPIPPSKAAGCSVNYCATDSCHYTTCY